MTCEYTVVRFVPDPLTDESINIGVVVIHGGVVRVRFLERWDRVRRFANADIGFLRSFAERVSGSAELQSTFVGLLPDAPITAETILDAAGRWRNSIQFTPLRASVAEPDLLVSSLSRRFLVETQATTHDYRDRRHAVAFAARSIRGALLDQLGDAGPSYLKKGYTLSGKLERHALDVVVANGKPYFAAQGLSLEGPNVRQLSQQINSIKWLVDDLKRGENEDLPVGVFVLVPTKADGIAKDTLEAARGVFSELGASVVEESEAASWSREVARSTIARAS